jgi:hypothetical protein
VNRQNLQSNLRSDDGDNNKRLAENTYNLIVRTVKLLCDEIIKLKLVTELHTLLLQGSDCF